MEIMDNRSKKDNSPTQRMSAKITGNYEFAEVFSYISLMDPRGLNPISCLKAVEKQEGIRNQSFR